MSDQASRILDTIASALERGEIITLMRSKLDGGVFRVQRFTAHSLDLGTHTSARLTDALAQCAQAAVFEGAPWSEPDALDAESDVDAFDRATSGVL